MGDDSYLPLRWESSGDQWWYATPIDWAAANGLSHLVNHLLAFDPNLLIKLTSLRRIRRLESVWDDSLLPSIKLAQARAHVARFLFLTFDPSSGGGSGDSGGGQRNPLLRAGYGGWLLYTAAAAGDVSFVKELIEREPLGVFGEGEYGITDILYGAARSKNSEVFRVLLNLAIEMAKTSHCEAGEGFLWEVMNRAVHAAARGGNLEILKEVLNCSDVLVYKDVEGSSVLHSASAKGQVEVVKYLISTYDIIHSTDNQGNTALHVAAYRGYTSLVEVLALAFPSLSNMKNNNGDTFLHVAVAGFLSPGFHRTDQQMELIKQIVSGKIINLKEIINLTNNEGRTVLHIAIAENIDPNVWDLLMTVPSIDANVRDNDGCTPRDLLKQCGDSNNALIKHVRTQGMLNSTSPGTSFRYPDADLFLYQGSENESEVSSECPSSRFSPCSSQLTSRSNSKSSSLRSFSGRFRSLLSWPRKEQRKFDRENQFLVNQMRPNLPREEDKKNIYNVCRGSDETPTPLRQKFTRNSILPNNKREGLTKGDFASPSTKERFATSLMQGVIQAIPPKSCYSPSSRFTSSSSPASSDKLKVENHKNGLRSTFFSGPLSGAQLQHLRGVDKQHRRVNSFNKSLMNQYFCFGAQDLAVEDSVNSVGVSRSCRRLVF